ncbi:DoxX family protein [Staphylococcus simiae]|uniref:DoxX family protein n=1 Tax=Staphylococcus simiae TaxID=308354 RepID=UPI001A97D1C0|nr:DoxX family protein [Staphylococcus simiae]MBO1199992.1 DoxX family protein [Staphylococcus simiae]MBO1200756.1 DoxX family protein [Staphylococcus simiae]MBO1204528.1 DoxX family protein [Staphylococcus simiae]MBO1210560.1 DoxX family protein [Staphylococcus simiae]MBO1229092.1 DoxX family protein [Staphylococcus simiae]
MKTLQLILIFIVRLVSGIIMLQQGFEKLTGNFTLKGLVPVIKDNTDSPVWYKWFFEHVVAQSTSLFDLVIPLGELAIGLGLLFGVLSYAASFFGAFVMLNYILADMIFTYPLQLALFIILLMHQNTLRQLSLQSVIHYIKSFKNRGENKHDAHPSRR